MLRKAFLVSISFLYIVAAAAIGIYFYVNSKLNYSLTKAEKAVIAYVAYNTKSVPQVLEEVKITDKEKDSEEEPEEEIIETIEEISVFQGSLEKAQEIAEAVFWQSLSHSLHKFNKKAKGFLSSINVSSDKVYNKLSEEFLDHYLTRIDFFAKFKLDKNNTKLEIESKALLVPVFTIFHEKNKKETLMTKFEVISNKKNISLSKINAEYIEKYYPLIKCRAQDCGSCGFCDTDIGKCIPYFEAYKNLSDKKPTILDYANIHEQVPVEEYADAPNKIIAKFKIAEPLVIGIKKFTCVDFDKTPTGKWCKDNEWTTFEENGQYGCQKIVKDVWKDTVCKFSENFYSWDLAEKIFTQYNVDPKDKSITNVNEKFRKFSTLFWGKAKALVETQDTEKYSPKEAKGAYKFFKGARVSLNKYKRHELLAYETNSKELFRPHYELNLKRDFAFTSFANLISDSLLLDKKLAKEELENYAICKESKKAHNRRIFISSINYTGNLIAEAKKYLGIDFSGVKHGLSPGLRAADALCQHRARVARLGGFWRALLSDSQTDAKDRLNSKTKLYLKNERSVVNSGDIWDGAPDRFIDADEFGKTTSPSRLVWTGTDINGNKLSLSNLVHCQDWTSTEGTGRVGIASSGRVEPYFNWVSYGGGIDCTEPKALYCYEP